MDKHTKTINPNLIPHRDYLAMALILGATKAAVHKDHKKEKNRKACRGRHSNREE